MKGMQTAIVLVVFAIAWVGHACIWTWGLNCLYALPISKRFLKVWRLATGLAIIGFPALPWSAGLLANGGASLLDRVPQGVWGGAVLAYTGACLLMGAAIFPAITACRLCRRPPPIVLSETTATLDLRAELGDEALGDGKWSGLMRLPFNCVLQVDFTELTLTLPRLPASWEGLTILLVSDVHFHRNPSRAFFDRVIAEIETRWPTSDLVCLAGDYVDSDEHRSWIAPVLGRLRATEGKFAILGNHDANHDPDLIRQELQAAGYTAIGNNWVETTIRGQRCVVVGHEGPWFRPAADLNAAPADLFRLCLSHTPDNFYWGRRNRIDLMLCGHVHGGQVRLPVIGSIFVPSLYSRRFDMGVFEGGGTAMVVNRGLSGKEPLRFCCHPQVVRVTLRSRIGG
jgi:predicted MPP superfamily phosphohydrolase